MKFGLSPSYKDIFNQPSPSLDELLFDIPSRVVIAWLSLINAELFTIRRDEEVQNKLFAFVTRRFTNNQKNFIIYKISSLATKSGKSPQISNTWYTTEFIQHEIINYRNFEIIDTTPDQEYRLFKAYLIIGDEINKKKKIILENIDGKIASDDSLMFQRIHWPLLIDQHDFNNYSDPIFYSIKSYLLLHYFSAKSETSSYVKNFLNLAQKESIWEYILELLQLAKLKYDKNDDQELAVFIISAKGNTNLIYDKLSIDLDTFLNDTALHKDYKGLRKYPLFKMSDTSYYVLNWNYLINQLNIGLQFDFFESSGIKAKYNTFANFRNEIAYLISEKVIFKNLLKYSLRTKYSKTIFDDNNIVSSPDCYHREGKHVFLFEFKDNLFPSEAVDSRDYHKIKSDIDKKFISNRDGQGKGVNQLINQIVVLNQGGYVFDDFKSKGYKRRNLCVYPIIVYTHSMYSLPGINKYLNQAFQKEVEEIKSRMDFKLGHVYNLTMIDLEFFYHHFMNLRSNKISLRKLIMSYHSKIEVKSNKVVSGSEEFFRIFLCFEEANLQLNQRKDLVKHEGYIDQLFNIFNISKNLK